ncbi:MAG: serine O-acetyltransferase [Planctomycetales bacterium]
MLIYSQSAPPETPVHHFRMPHAPLADPVWTAIRAEAWSELERDIDLAQLLTETVLESVSLEQALGTILADKLASQYLGKSRLQMIFKKGFDTQPQIRQSIRIDLQAVRDRDPASGGFLIPFLFFKGFQALQAYRVAHWLWHREQRFLAIHFQNRISEIFGVDIHPAARIGSGVLMDHATSIVIGETSVVEDNVSLLHEVTLGGTGKETGDRHPKVRQGVLIGAGSKILGNIEIGTGSKVGAGSVVLDPVPPHCTVAGVPARIVSRSETSMPALDMNQQFPHLLIDGGGI